MSVYIMKNIKMLYYDQTEGIDLNKKEHQKVWYLPLLVFLKYRIW